MSVQKSLPTAPPAVPTDLPASLSGDPSVDPSSEGPLSGPSNANTSSKASAGGASYLTGTQTGEGTFYPTGLGSCGITNTDADFIAAVSHKLYDTYPGFTAGNPNENPVCNKKIRAKYNGKEVEVTVTDRCEGCELTDLDFSPAAFNTLSDPSAGRIHGITWEWV